MAELQFQIEVDKELRGIVDNVMVDLNRHGYKATPTRNGTVLDVVAQMAQNAWENRELLKTLFEAATPVIGFLIGRMPKKEKETEEPFKITIEIDEQPVIIEVSDANNVTKLLEKFRAAHPEAEKKLSSKSKVKVKVGRK